MAYLPIPLTPEHCTANPPYLDFVRADPLRRLEATARFFWETARLDASAGAPPLACAFRCCSRARTTR